MKSLALLLTAVSAYDLVDDLKVVNFENVANKPRSLIRKASLSKFSVSERATDQVSLSNQQNLYAINLSVGTPAQNISAQIDTGSSDLWFPVQGSTLCSQRTSSCDDFGAYSTSSSTRKALSQTFSITYGDGTKIQGTFVTDNIKLGASSLSAVQFAACTSGSSSTGIQGIMGVGYESNEATAARGGSTYPNIVASMVSQGAINSMAYSLWLNDPDSAAGNVLFGGIDTAKFSGTLVSMPVVPSSDGQYEELSLPLTAIIASGGGQTMTLTKSGYASPALIDSGTTLMYLPDDIVSAVYTAYSVISVQQTPLMPCSYGNDASAKLTFQFNGATNAQIDVLLNDLLSETTYTKSGVQYCELLVSGGAPDGLIILGDAFMRSAYLVYDLTNNMIAVAQSKFNVTDSSIKEISSSGIPSASVMSSLVAGLAVASTATDAIPGAGSTAFASGAGSSGAVETTASVPTFKITATSAGAASSATGSKSAAAGFRAQGTAVGVVGIVAATVTMLSVMGGAMIVWF